MGSAAVDAIPALRKFADDPWFTEGGREKVIEAISRIEGEE